MLMATSHRQRRARRVAYADLSPEDRALIDESRRIAAEQDADPQWQAARRLTREVLGEHFPDHPDKSAR